MHFSEFDANNVTPNQKTSVWLDVSTDGDERMWQLPLLAARGAQAGPTLVVTAGVHGDEYEGVEAILDVFERVAPATLRGTLLMLSVCNRPAYELIRRSSPVDGLNLARVFPGAAGGTLTERIAHWMTERLLRAADFYIDLHSGGITAQIPTLVGYVHDSGALGQRSRAGAEAFGAPVQWGHPLPLPPGRTISAATELGVPSLYTEAPGGGYARPDDVTCFADGVLNVMRHLNMLDGEPQPRPMTHDLFGDGNLDHVIETPVAGYFRAEVELLQTVEAGQRLGTVRSLLGETLAEITASRAGIVIMLRRLHRVNAGDGVAQITGELA